MVNLDAEFHTLEAKTQIHKILGIKDLSIVDKRNRLLEIFYYVSDNLDLLNRKIAFIENTLSIEG